MLRISDAPSCHSVDPKLLIHPTHLQGMGGTVERKKKASLANYFYEHVQSISNRQSSVPYREKKLEEFTI